MKKFIAIVSLCTVFLLGACSVTTSNATDEQSRPLKIWYENTNGAYHTYCVVDDNTGVNYIVVSTERGNGEYSIAMTPRLNADGSLYTSK